MREQDLNNITPDLELGAILRDNTAQPPLDAVDWNALHRRITTRAQPLLRRAPAPWWQLIAGWSGFGIPATAAAAALLMLLLGTAVMRPTATSSAGTVAYSSLEEDLHATAGAVLNLNASAEDILEDMLLESVAW
jgi:hypothetical protein